jgi:hypothetical protein
MSVPNAATNAGGFAERAGNLFPQDVAQFRVLAEQSGWSRINGGIHYPSDERAAGLMGKSSRSTGTNSPNRRG